MFDSSSNPGMASNLATILPLLLGSFSAGERRGRALSNAAPGLPQSLPRQNAVPYMPGWPGANASPQSNLSALGSLAGGGGAGGLGNMLGGGGGGSSSGLLSGLKSGKGGSSGMLSAAGSAALADPAYADALTASFGAVGL